MFLDNLAGCRSQTVSDKRVRAAATVVAKLLEIDERVAEQLILQIVDTPQREPSAEALLDVAERIRVHRGRRKGLFPQPIFGEPPWDMLLALYTEYPKASSSIRDLASTVNLPTTSVTRWLGYLEDHDLIRRRPNPTDKRSTLVELTDSARRSLDHYLAGVELG